MRTRELDELHRQITQEISEEREKEMAEFVSNGSNGSYGKSRLTLKWR